MIEGFPIHESAVYDDAALLQAVMEREQVASTAIEGGVAIPFHAASVVAALGEPEVYLRIALNLGEATATAWGCDLTEEYVVFNSAYTT